MNPLRRAHLVSAMFLTSAMTCTASFAIDCTKAKTEPELAICFNPELKAYDSYLANAYSAVRSTVPTDAFKEVRQKQHDWIVKRDALCGGDVPCLTLQTQLQTAALNGFVQTYTEHLREQLLRANMDGSTQHDEQRPSQPLRAEDIYRKAALSVVVVLAFNKRSGKLSQGSGVAISSETVATNCHVVADADSALVLFKGNPYPATVVSGNKAFDYCILRAVGLPAHPAETATLSSVAPGERVYSIGNPRGLDLTIADGLVSGLRHQDGLPLPLIQTSAPISPGSSGGGLFDEYGRVIGITTSILTNSQNIGFALPIELSLSIAK